MRLSTPSLSRPFYASSAPQPLLALLLLLLFVAPACQPSGEAPVAPAPLGSASRASKRIAALPPRGAHIASQYSKIIIREKGSIRTLYFVRDNGEVVIESQMDIQHPEELLVRYTRTMFVNFLFNAEPQRALIVGLGAGSMVRFLQHHTPKQHIDAIEIDPAIVLAAQKYFGTHSSETVKLITADGFEFLKDTKGGYDVIYMDAFLKPSEDTDNTGVPLRLKTVQFFKEIQTKLNPKGVVVFNLNQHGSTQRDIKSIRQAFTNVYIFGVPRTGNLIVVGSTDSEVQTIEFMKARALKLDERFKAKHLSFSDVVDQLKP